MDWKTGTASANGIDLHYRRGGDGPSVVLAHGITDDGRCWPRLAEALARDYDLVMIDARGHGLSSKPESGYSPLDHAADLAGLIRVLDLDRPAFIGHSMGAVNVAVTAGEYPDLARCVVLEDPPWLLNVGPMARRDREEWRKDIQRRNAQSLETLIEEGRAEHPNWDTSEFEPWATSKQLVSPAVLEWLPAGRDSDWQADAKRLDVPTLLITGDPDQGALVTPEAAEVAKSLAADLSVANIAGTGHSIRREGFEDYLSVVRAFLSAHLPS